LETEEQKAIVIDQRLDSYVGFLQSDFASHVFDAADRATQIKHFALHLMADWRSISYAVAFPALSPASVERFHIGMLSAGPLDYSLLDLLESLLLRLNERIPSLTSDQQLRDAIKAELTHFINELAPLTTERDKHISAHAIWNQLIDQHSMPMGIHAIMRLSYTGLFGTYEEFLVRCTRILSGNAKVRSTSGCFQSILERAYGHDKAKLCWSSTKLSIIREIRNRLVHAGGKAKEGDSALASMVHIEDGYMHVFPCHIVNAYLAIKPPILAILSHPGFA
jgi:hypothetical protein